MPTSLAVCISHGNYAIVHNHFFHFLHFVVRWWCVQDSPPHHVPRSQNHHFTKWFTYSRFVKIPTTFSIAENGVTSDGASIEQILLKIIVPKQHETELHQWDKYILRKSNIFFIFEHTRMCWFQVLKYDYENKQYFF